MHDQIFKNHFPSGILGLGSLKSRRSSLPSIKILRNKKYPTHPDDRQFMEAVRYFGQNSFPPDWTTLWETVLKAVVESLTMVRDKLQ